MPVYSGVVQGHTSVILSAPAASLFIAVASIAAASPHLSSNIEHTVYLAALDSVLFSAFDRNYFIP